MNTTQIKVQSLEFRKIVHILKLYFIFLCAIPFSSPLIISKFECTILHFSIKKKLQIKFIKTLLIQYFKVFYGSLWYLHDTM